MKNPPWKRNLLTQQSGVVLRPDGTLVVWAGDTAVEVSLTPAQKASLAMILMDDVRLVLEAAPRPGQ